MSLSPSNLTVIRGESASWPLQVYTDLNVAAIGIFSAQNTLSCELFYGDDSVLPVYPQAAWTDAPNAKYVVTISGPQTSLLLPGNYTLVVSAAGLNQDPAILEIPFIVQPAPAGVGTLRALATPADFWAFVPDQTGNPAVAQALASATKAIEALCRRALVLTSFDKLYRPGRTRRIYLETWPIAIVTSVTTDLVSAMNITNAATNGVSIATVSMGRAGIWNQPYVPTSLTFTTVASGLPTVQTLQFANYPTVQALANAISLLGNGWSVITNPGGYGPMQVMNWPPSRLFYTMGQFGAINAQVPILAYITDLTLYDVHPELGYIELTQNVAEAYRYADRSYGQGFGWSWSSASEPRNANVRVQYRAGYAVAQADVAAGYEPVQDDLKMACVLTAQAILATAPMVGEVLSQSVDGRAYKLREDSSIVPKSARPLLNRYNNYRLKGSMST